MNDDKKLVFIYNADSGLINAVKDYFHKKRSPETYQCNLCFQTFGAISMKKEWKNYVKNLDIPAEFLHKDEFENKYVIKNAKFPSAYFEKDNGLEVFITQDEMNAVKTIDELKI